MTETVSAMDAQRALYRYLTKCARKGELADPELARARMPGSGDAHDVASVAEAMHERMVEHYPDAPDLRSLLGGATPDELEALQGYDWVTAGIYAFGLPPTKTISGTPESSAHRALKEWAAANGELLGAPADAVAVTERWFPSGDESDAAFIGASEALIVEVRPLGAEAHELQQALFALVKMRAVLEAEPSLDGPERVVRAMLVLEAEPLPETRSLSDRLDVQLLIR
ncbi:MAG: hypothetical protein OXH13_06165 [Chloroflexi bacterium]|nr:hypothetical protein [Chloroflexota bacterium]MCY3696396.1 hypothetical protein [Chloroflexota bacterium]